MLTDHAGLPADTTGSLPGGGAPAAGYAELHCVSNFTFLRGASHPEELVARAAALGYAGLALTDECSLAGVVRAYSALEELREKVGDDNAPAVNHFKLIIGSEFTLACGLKLVLLAADRDGYGNLAELITRARRRAPKGDYHLAREDLADGVPDCLALWLPQLPANDLDAQAQWFADTFPERGWIGVELLRDGDDPARLAGLTELGRRIGLPLAACGDVHMHVRQRRQLQDTLTAIRLVTPVAAAGHALYPNAERCLRPRHVLARLYPTELLAQTLRIAARCHFTLDSLRYEYPEELVPAGLTPTQWLRELTEAGIKRRWPAGVPDTVRGLIEHELALIAELAYEPYFLTVHDIVTFARSRGILCQGRGSAANSAVCFALGITEVDPARMEMLFERFISKERNEPPDIDVDFEHERREEVIQYLYSKYGRERAALAATVITYRARSALRDVGKALGLDLDQVDRLAKTVHWWDGRRIDPARLKEAGFDPDAPVVQRVLHLTREILGFPRHLSQHVGGFVIARDRLCRLVPIENAAMPQRTVIQWDKDDLDALGLLKVDCLGLGMLSAIRRAFALVAGYRGARLTMASVPAEDPAVYAMIQAADTVGVFQIESRAQMAMLPRLRPACFYDLVIEVAIVRPGPIQGDMVHPYLRRRQGTEAVTYPSKAVEAVLARTLGIPIFQEQVIKLAMVAAGFSPGEADRLRRSMAAWRRRGGLAPFQQRLVDGMRERGYAEDFAQRIFQQILGFGEYGFPESHAASFSLLVYVSAWLKRYEPAAFTAALLNSQPMGFYAPAQLVQDARGHDVEVREVDARYSDWDCTLESNQTTDSPALRLGLRLVKNFSRAGAQRLAAARETALFKDVDDLARRGKLNRRDLAALASAGALAGLAGHRHQAHWEVAGVEQTLPLFAQEDEVSRDVRKPAAVRRGDAPLQLRAPTEGENIVADYASVGLTLGRHPLALLRPQLVRREVATIRDVFTLTHGDNVHTAGLVTCRQHPSSASGVVFLTVEDETGACQLIVWPRLAQRRRRALVASRLLGVVGEVQREGEVLHVIAKDLIDYSSLLGALVTRSRDFH